MNTMATRGEMMKNICWYWECCYCPVTLLVLGTMSPYSNLHLQSSAHRLVWTQTLIFRFRFRTIWADIPVQSQDLTVTPGHVLYADYGTLESLSIAANR
jgi:hypothetical protein